MIHNILRARLLAKKGLLDQPAKVYPTYAELTESEWSPEFETLMRNRLIMGALRYGKLRAAGKPTYDRIPSIVKRLKLYQESGNLEHLVDCANLCLCEFVEGTHPSKHFSSLDNHNHHTTTKQ